MSEDNILAFVRLEAAGNGKNLQKQIRSTSRKPDGLPAISRLLGGSSGDAALGTAQGAAQGFIQGGTTGAVLGGIRGFRGGSQSFAKVMPKRPPQAKLVFAQEQERVMKRNVLFGYVEKSDTYTAEVIETTVTRFSTHEPCVEHLPARFESDVDEKGRLQDLLAGVDPEGVNYTVYRNSEDNGGFGG